MSDLVLTQPARIPKASVPPALLAPRHRGTRDFQNCARTPADNTCAIQENWKTWAEVFLGPSFWGRPPSN